MQNIPKIDFFRNSQEKEKDSLTFGCHGDAFVRVTSKPTNLAKITFLFCFPWKSGHMTLPIIFFKKL